MSLKNPRLAGKHITEVAKHVTIIDGGIDKAVEEALIRIKDGRLSLDLKSYKNLAGIHPNQANSSNVDWVFMTSALNFSFWNLENEPQYLVTYKGKTQNGYMSMCAAINRTLENGIALTDPKFYKEITKSQLDEYLMGDSSVPCPMIEERVKCLHGKLNQISCNLQIQNDFY